MQSVYFNVSLSTPNTSNRFLSLLLACISPFLSQALAFRVFITLPRLHRNHRVRPQQSALRVSSQCVLRRLTIALEALVSQRSMRSSVEMTLCTADAILSQFRERRY